MKKILYFIILSLFLISSSNAKAEFIDAEDEVKDFGDWKSFCKKDVMMGAMDCKIASKFYENNAVMTIEPLKNSSAKLVIIIPQVRVGDPVFIRVDKNSLIESGPIKTKDFNLVPLQKEQKDLLYNQMVNGEFLFLRFNLSDTEKEITVKLNLKDFRNALAHTNNQLL